MDLGALKLNNWKTMISEKATCRMLHFVDLNYLCLDNSQRVYLTSSVRFPFMTTAEMGARLLRLMYVASLLQLDGTNL